jgi:hypothetical protein
MATLKLGVTILRVRIPPDQSENPQVGSEPCDGVGNHDGETPAHESVSRENVVS